MLLLTIALLVAGQSNLKTVYVATLPELVVAMEDPMVGRIFVNKVCWYSVVHHHFEVRQTRRSRLRILRLAG